MCRLAASAPRGFGLCGWAERVVGSQAAVLPAAVRSQLLSQEAPLRPRRPLSVHRALLSAARGQAHTKMVLGS